MTKWLYICQNFEKMKKTTSISFLIFLITFSAFSQKGTISGYVYEKGSRESLVGVNIYDPIARTGTSTNIYGFYSLTLNSTDSVIIRWSYVGYKTVEKKLLLKEDLRLDIFLEHAGELEEVVIMGEGITKLSEDVRMSVMEIKPKDVKMIPALLGEKDVFKALQLMPGVQKGNEGSSGLYVRGGGPDQNLIILDEAVVYNANHLFGFFSLFNGDALKSIELTKGGFPARHGGRLSSVVEMTMKDGNKEKFGGEAGIGFISSKLLLEGPIIKDKSSFIISGRRTYIDVLTQPFIIAQTQGTTAGYYFYDLNAKVNYDFGSRDKVYLSGYFGRDKFYLNDLSSSESTLRSGLYWQNSTGTLRWNHLFNNKLFSNASLIFSNYTMSVYAKNEYNSYVYSLRYLSNVNDFAAKYDLHYHLSPNHNIRFGISSVYHLFTPGSIVLKDDDPSNDLKFTKREYGIETSLYVEDEMKFYKNKLRLNPGFRLTSFAVKGEHYWSPEPRFSASYMLKPDFAIKASYASMSQFLHLLSHTGVGLPTDLWVPSTKNIRPQNSWQVASGIAKDFTQNDLSLSLEGYYKKSDNIIGYKEGASFLSIDGSGDAMEYDWERNITNGQAWSYGAEVLFRKNSGKFSGWVGYTLSWTQMQFDELNFGEKFYARYDRRHDVSVVSIFRFNEDISLSATWVYGTGNAITLPFASFSVGEHHLGTNNMIYNHTVSDYGEKNSFRMAPYHRFDLGLQIHKVREKYESTVELGVYNLYNRKNPFYYYIESVYNEDRGVKNVLKQLSIFPIIPSISWNIKF